MLSRGSWLLAVAWIESLVGGGGGGRGFGGRCVVEGQGEGCWNRLVNWALVGLGPSGGLGGLIIFKNSCKFI